MFLLLAACSPPAAPTAIELRFDGARSGTTAESVQAALDELYVRCDAAAAAVPPAGDAGVAALAGRVQALELRMDALEREGLYHASEVSYDPRATTLTARTLQSAIDELAKRLEDAERVDQGPPGPALFELRDKNGKRIQVDGEPVGGPGGPPPGGSGPGGPPPGGSGPGGPPPGGSGGSGPMQGGGRR